ncbi:MAG: DNA-directed RNA polymerase subunit beta, partial [Bacteroidetes bacterium]|nr:DNA-directed RNA polymerase subunit beta [Bacteroidota bacterium]
DNVSVIASLRDTLLSDKTVTKEDAITEIYKKFRPTDPPTLKIAESFFENMFFNPDTYRLSQVGRLKINYKLNHGISDDVSTLTKEDISGTLGYLLDLRGGRGATDDIDHLGNRRVRTVGELIEDRFYHGLERLARSVKEKMGYQAVENLMPSELLIPKTVIAVVKEFFATGQLSQFMDQTNPLSEITHKRRLSALGPGGLTRERAGFEVRDVHSSHYGRICPIETPEGPNIGLISSLSTYGKINEFGFIQTPYRVVKKARVTDEIVYMNALAEEKYIIAQANAPLDKKGNFTSEFISVRQGGEFLMIDRKRVDLMDVSPAQLVSVSASLIPFLEHDDANRALMGSNMQRQAVPLLQPKAPIVGTGMEKKVARDSRALILAEDEGVVEYVDSDKIIVKYDVNPNSIETLTSFNTIRRKTYTLIKFHGTNQETCMTQRPIVSEGQRVAAGDVLADGTSTENGELALGRNILVAFMPWRGYNFEDAIIVSERVVSDDIYTSLHIEEFELQVRETKRGEEELTREIPNVSEEAVKNLDENGIIREGAEVKEGDILIGKITPKGETDPTPEEKLLRAIFGEKAGDVKDASLKAPPGLKGTIIKTRLFSRKRRDTESKKLEKQALENLEQEQNHNKNQHYTKLVEKLSKLCDGLTASGIRDLDGSIVIRSGTKIKEDTFTSLDDVTKLDYTLDWFPSKKDNNHIHTLFNNYFDVRAKLEEEYKREKIKVVSGDELAPGIVQLAKVYVAKKRKLSVGDKMAGRHGNKGVVAKIVPKEDMPFLPDGTPVDIILNPLGVPSRMNLGQLYETALGWVGEKLGVEIIP